MYTQCNAHNTSLSCACACNIRTCSYLSHVCFVSEHLCTYVWFLFCVYSIPITNNYSRSHTTHTLTVLCRIERVENCAINRNRKRSNSNTQSTNTQPLMPIFAVFTHIRSLFMRYIGMCDVVRRYRSSG